MKTLSCAELKDTANDWISRPQLTDTEKRLIHSFVETLLMRRKAYRGYSYRYWIERGYEEWVNDGEPDDKTPYLYGSYSKEDIVFY